MESDTNYAFGKDRQHAYNGYEEEADRSPLRNGRMRRVLTTMRCVPRYGYDYASVRTIDVDLGDSVNEQEIVGALNLWFAQKGVAEAVYDVDYDDDGCFAIINDEAYMHEWGAELL